MVQIESGASSSLLTVDTNSSAIRVTEYDTAGIELNPPVQGVYMLPISIRISAAAISGGSNALWTMRLSSSAAYNVYIRRMFIRSSFDGTEATSNMELQVIRFTTFTPSGGNALTPIPMNRSYPTSVVTDARQTAGAAVLTTTFVVTDPNGHFAAIQQAHRDDSNCELDLDFHNPSDPYGQFKMVADDGLMIRINTASVAGASISGYIMWEER